MSRTSVYRPLSAIAILLAASASVNYLQAQTTASIMVVATDREGKPIVGQEVKIQSAQRGLQKTLVTNSRGEVSIAGLLPGVYMVEGRAIAIKADERATVRLRVQIASATVDIEASPLDIETSSVGVQTTFLPEDIEKLPLPVHRYVEYSYLTPGVSPSGRPEPVVLGSMLDSNAFVIDGMPTNLSSTGRFGLNISSEIIESQTITTGGHKAEIGSTAGGVFSLTTKSGTNEFKGSLVGYAIWRSMNARPYKGLVNTPEERATDAREWAVTLGGPIVKDKLFFFGAFNRQLSSLDYENVAPFGFNPRTRSQEEDRSYRFAKLTWVMGGSHRLEFAIFGDPVTQTSFQAAGDPLIKDDGMPSRNRGGDSYLLRHVGALAQALTWENTLGIHKTSFYTYPMTPYAGPHRTVMDAPNSETFGRYPDERLERQRNLSFRSDFTLVTGHHRIKTGFQGLQSDFTLAFLRPSGGISYMDRAIGGNGPDEATLQSIRNGLSQYNNGLDYGYGSTFSLTTLIGGQTTGGRDNYLYQRTLASMNNYGDPLKSSIIGIYIQDDWQLTSNWVLNLGLRYDQVKMKSEDGSTIFSHNTLSPRLGISWSPTNKRNFRLFAYYGRIYSPPAPGNFTAAGATTGGPALERQVWIPELHQWKTWQRMGVQDARNVAVADLQAPKTDMYQLGAERVQNIPGLGTWHFEAVATHKRVRDLIDTYDRIYGYLPELEELAASSSTGRVIANLPGLTRDFFGLDLVARRRLESGHLMQFSYSYGELTGNSEVGNVSSATASHTVFARIPNLREDYRLPQYDGYLNESLRHSFKTFCTARLPYSFEMSGIFALRTGMHYSLLDHRRISGHVVLAENAKRGSETLPSVSSLDLALAYNLKMNKVDIRMAIEGFNILNSQPMIIVENRVTSSSFGPTNHQQPRAFQLSCRAVF